MTSPLSRIPLRLQLVAIIGLSCLMGLTVAFSVVLWREQTSFRENLIASQQTAVKMLGDNAAAALRFEDAKGAEEILSSLRYQSEVVAATLFTAKGTALAHYHAQGRQEAIQSPGGNNSSTFVDDHLITERLVYVNGERVGSLQTVTSLRKWKEERDEYLLLTAALGTTSLGLALLVGLGLQRLISRRVQRLANSMSEVRESRNYGIRIEEDSRDELGQLASGFNQMLSEIQSRDTELQQANELLEARVLQRTAELEAEIAEREAKERELESKRQQLSSLFESAPIGILKIDRDGRILEANEAEADILSRPAAGLVGEPFAQFHLEANDAQELLRRLLSGETVWEMETSIVDGNGNHRTLLINAVAYFDGRRFEWGALFCRDVTLVRQAEEIQRAREQAEKANQAKNEFLSRISHELRTPMNSILGFGQLLEMELQSDQSKESIHQILKAGRHLLNLIDDVLNISKIESGEITVSLESVDVCQAIRDAVDLVMPMAAHRGIRIQTMFEPDHSVWATADWQRLSQILLNLLSNAVKYNVENGKVVCSVSKESGQVVIRVEDTGVGISELDAERLFVPFDRMGAEHSSVEGTGLGLPLSKTLAESMNGALALERREGGIGTCFAIRLGEAEGPQVGPSALTVVENGFADKKILLIEDNLANVKLVEQLMQSRPNVRLIVAMQGNLGIDLARKHRPDAVILDVNLPDTDGFEVVKKLRQDPELQDLAILVLTADATASTKLRLKEIGVQAFLAKPIEVPVFFATLDGLFKPEVRAVA